MRTGAARTPPGRCCRWASDGCAPRLRRRSELPATDSPWLGLVSTCHETSVVTHDTSRASFRHTDCARGSRCVNARFLPPLVRSLADMPPRCCLQRSLRGLRRRSKSSENGLQSHPLPTPDSPPVGDAPGSPGRPPTTNSIFKNRPPSPLSDLPSVRLLRRPFPVTTCQELWPPSHTRPPPLRSALDVGSKAVGLSDKMHAPGPVGTAHRDG